ncbi:hypothetical protein ACFLS1_12495 [Verrucomicrobiota bacterium]
MKIEELPKWMNIIPVLIGVVLAITGMYVFPLLGMRNTLGPIIGLPVGFIIGFVILSIIAKNKKS